MAGTGEHKIDRRKRSCRLSHHLYSCSCTFTAAVWRRRGRRKIYLSHCETQKSLVAISPQVYKSIVYIVLALHQGIRDSSILGAQVKKSRGWESFSGYKGGCLFSTIFWTKMLFGGSRGGGGGGFRKKTTFHDTK